MTPAYAELHCVSNYSFLEGASHAAELVQQAALAGLAAIGIADRNSVAGAVRAHIAAKEAGLRLLPGARLDLMLVIKDRQGEKPVPAHEGDNIFTAHGYRHTEELFMDKGLNSVPGRGEQQVAH
ncbi:MAG: PHP domain-containing protein, partial [Rhodospirillales bacterium]